MAILAARAVLPNFDKFDLGCLKVPSNCMLAASISAKSILDHQRIAFLVQSVGDIIVEFLIFIDM